MISTLFILLACIQDPAPWADVHVMSRLDEGIGGPKAQGQIGDYIIENDKVRVVVLGPRASFGPGLFGGSVLDADLRRVGARWANGHGNDQFAELNPTVNLDVARVDKESQFEMLEGNNGEAILRVRGTGVPYLDVLGPLRAITPATEPNVAFVTEYTLAPGETWLTMKTTVTVIPALESGTAELEGIVADPVEPGESVVDSVLGGGISMGDFYQQGGSVDAFMPNIGYDESGAVYDAAQSGRNLFTDPFNPDFLAGTADGVSYGIAAADGVLAVPLFASSQTVAFGGIAYDLAQIGDSYTYERYFSIGEGDIGSVLEGILIAKSQPYGTVHGFVVEDITGEPLSGAHVFVYAENEEAPYMDWITDVSLDDNDHNGSFGGAIPVGNWELVVHQEGRATSGRVPVQISEGDSLDLVMVGGQAGAVTFNIRDETGMEIPAKVTVIPVDRPSLRDPVLGDSYISGDPEVVLFAPYGSTDTHLPAGDYVAYATRGLEYDLDSVNFTVSIGGETHVDLQVERAIDSSGWVSADLHVHAQPSFDSGVSPQDRVVSMVCEGVEFMASTDHDYIFDYSPTIENLGLEHWLTSTVGVEVSPIEVGHYLAFPLVHDFLADAGGAFDWYGDTPGEIIASLEARGNAGIEPVTIVAHPRDGILGYFDQYGFSSYGGSPGIAGGEGFPDVTVPATTMLSNFTLFNEQNFTLDFDALELFNGKRFDLIRTPTELEIAEYAADHDSVGSYDIMVRTEAEMEALIDGTYTLGYGVDGQVDDWFTLLNLGFRHTALANSDTHGMTSIEAGCPRNFVASPTDYPGYISEADIAAAIKDHAVIASYGPFVQMWIDGEIIGSTVTGGGEHQLEVEVQAPDWMGVDRVELYENGTLIEVWDEGLGAGIFHQEITVTPERDSWYVVIAMGEGSLWPLFTPVEMAPVHLEDSVMSAVGAVIEDTSLLGTPVHLPLTGEVHPYGLTNPIWVDLDGDGFDAPGIPAWLVEPSEPVESEE
jgi:hypothetical protein